MPRTQSLRTQLTLRLVAPLTALICLSAAISYFVAMHFANLAYDHWLLDSTHSLAQAVKFKAGTTSVELPPTALEIFQWDAEDKTYFKIKSYGVGLLAGYEDIPAPPDPNFRSPQPAFYNASMRGDRVRVVALQLFPPGASDRVLVQVAETLTKRRTLAGEILIVVVVPQVVLICVAGILIWSGIDRGLRPLRHLATEIAARTHRDLRPILDQHVPEEVRTLTDTINDLLQRLGAALSAQQRFIADAAHQLRTPLAALKLQTERALRAADVTSLRPALAQLRVSADRAAHLSNQLLVLARSEPGFDAFLGFAPVDLCALVRDICSDWVPAALERDIDLGVVTAAQPVVIEGDATLLGELLGNLLDNAIRYGRDHGNITVTVRAEPTVQLIAEDDGAGIPEFERARVLERFHRVAGSPGDGCGLGLAIVNEIARAHHASVRISSPDRGSGTKLVVDFAALTLSVCSQRATLSGKTRDHSSVS